MCKFAANAEIQDERFPVSSWPATIMHSLSSFVFLKTGSSRRKCRWRECFKADINLPGYDLSTWFPDLPLRHICNEICRIQLRKCNGQPLEFRMAPSLACPSFAGSTVGICCNIHPLVSSLVPFGLVSLSFSPRVRSYHLAWPYQQFWNTDA